MSSEYGWKFRDFHPPGEGAIFGVEDCSKFTVTRCPVCGVLVWTPRGHLDTTHNCTIICPYSGDQMWYIPGNPSQAKDRNGNPIILQGLGGPNASEQLIEEFKRYFMYCPNSACSFYVDSGFAYIQRRVETEVIVGR